MSIAIQMPTPFMQSVCGAKLPPQPLPPQLLSIKTVRQIKTRYNATNKLSCGVSFEKTSKNICFQCCCKKKLRLSHGIVFLRACKSFFSLN